MKAKTTTLWERIQKFPIDEPGAEHPFSARLAAEQGWTRPYTQEVIGEYRKFLWLCCNGSAPSSPSPAVDEAWHLHLTYTRSYWHSLCRDTLGRDLHHEPTRGGPAQQAHFRNLYAETLDRYREAFDAEPPAHIWPAEERKTQKAKPKSLQLASLGALPLMLLSTAAAGAAGFIIPLLIVAALVLLSHLFGQSNSQPRNGKGKGKSKGQHQTQNNTNHTTYTGCTVFTGCSTGCSSEGHHAGDASCSSDGDSGGDSGCSSGCSSCGGGCGGGGD